MSKNTLTIVAITALIVLVIGNKLRQLPLLDKLPTA